MANDYQEPMANGEDHPLKHVDKHAIWIARTEMQKVAQNGDLTEDHMANPIADAVVLALHQAGHLAKENAGITRLPWPHRAVGGNESNQFDLIHGCCACCLVPWPCPSQMALDKAILTMAGADQTAWREAMREIGWLP